LKQEKDRLQSAVNDYMRQLKSAQQDVLTAKSESQNVLMQNNNRIEELTKYVARLETVVPANKLKKVKLGEVIQPDTPEIAVEEPVLPIDDESIKSGGTF
jgi:replication initiation and membrane attachment protein DnaB